MNNFHFHIPPEFAIQYLTGFYTVARSVMEVTIADVMDMTYAAYHACHLFVRWCLFVCVSEASCKERNSCHTKRSHTLRTRPHANGVVVPRRAPQSTVRVMQISRCLLLPPISILVLIPTPLPTSETQMHTQTALSLKVVMCRAVFMNIYS